MNRRSNRKPWGYGVAVPAVLILAVVWWNTSERLDRGQPQAVEGPADTYAVVSPPVEGRASVQENDPASPQRQSRSAPLSYGQQLRFRFDDLMAGNDLIDKFIIRHLELAEAGNADSAIYLSEAMKYCAMELNLVSLTSEVYDISTEDPSTIETQIMDQLVGHPEFYRSEARRHIQRAIGCQRLGWDPEYHREEATKWSDFARESGQPVAVAKWAAIKRDELLSDEKLDASKEVIRTVLQESVDFQVLLAASTVASASTGSDYLFDRLSWALAACEFHTCDSLNFYYRGLCEMQSFSGASYCTEDMTDLDYLFARHPDKFDAARAKAQEIKQAILDSRWDLLGLE